MCAVMGSGVLGVSTGIERCVFAAEYLYEKVLPLHSIFFASLSV